MAKLRPRQIRVAIRYGQMHNAAGFRAIGGSTVPITPFLQDHAFEPEVTRAMGMAFEDACRLLRLPDTTDPAAEIIAAKIIELAKSGEHDAGRLCNGAVMAFQRDR